MRTIALVAVTVLALAGSAVGGWFAHAALAQPDRKATLCAQLSAQYAAALEGGDPVFALRRQIGQDYQQTCR